MSDQKLREVLEEVIRDIDDGRMRVRRAPSRIAARLAPPLLAMGLGLGLSLGAAACDGRSIGVEGDGGVSADSGQVVPDARVPLPDAGPYPMYGPAFPEPDAGFTQDAAVPATEPDGGAYDLYGVPFDPGGDNG